MKPNDWLAEFPVRVGNKIVKGELHRTHRPGGRRIVVKDGDNILFDTQDCYHFADAANRLEAWAKSQP